jgi:hypothetical protein
MYITLLGSLNQFILIKLFENKATTRWFDKFSSKKFEKAVHLTNNSRYYSKEWRDRDVSLIQTQWNNIKSTLAHLHNIGFKIPFEIPDEYEYDQNKLNLLHRFFTYNALWYHDIAYSSKNHKNPFDSNFEIDCEYNEWHDIIDVINRSVHNLERYTKTSNKELLEVYPTKTIAVIMNSISSEEFWVDFDLEEQKENFKYQEYSSLGKPVVVLASEILGKSYLQSFLEHDDPTCRDCTGRLGSLGNFHIDLTDNRSKLYNSLKFKNWLSKYNIENPPLEFPIGSIVDQNVGSFRQINDVIFTKTI